jgi:hypothetical protein
MPIPLHVNQLCISAALRVFAVAKSQSAEWLQEESRGRPNAPVENMAVRLVPSAPTCL